MSSTSTLHAHACIYASEMINMLCQVHGAHMFSLSCIVEPHRLAYDQMLYFMEMGKCVATVGSATLNFCQHDSVIFGILLDFKIHKLIHGFIIIWKSTKYPRKIGRNYDLLIQEPTLDSLLPAVNPSDS